MIKRITVISLSVFLLAISTWAAPFKVSKPDSLVAVDARATPPHTFTSVLKDYEYDIRLDPDSLEAQTVKFAFNFADLDSDEPKRDKKMLGWMDVDTHPSAHFELTKVVDRDGMKIGMGTFYMHGVTKDIEVPFSIKRDGKTILIDGTAEFDYMDWDLKKVRLLIFTVKPELKVHFHLEGTLDSSK